MFSLFSSIRIMVAARGVAGDAAIEFIKGFFIPRVKASIQSAKTDQERASLEEALSLWEQYSDKSNPNSRLWEHTARKQLVTAGMRYGKFSEDEINEAEAKIVHDLFVRGHFEKVFSRHDPSRGPYHFNTFWKTIWNRRGSVFFRDEYHEAPMFMVEDETGKRKMVHRPPVSLDAPADDDVSNTMMMHMVDTKPDVDVAKREFRELKSDLFWFARKKLGDDDMAMEVFNRWMKAALKSSGRRISFMQDVLVPMRKDYETRGISLDKNVMYRYKDKVEKVIMDFFRGEKSYSTLPWASRRKGPVAARVARGEFRKRFAAWVLCAGMSARERAALVAAG